MVQLCDQCHFQFTGENSTVLNILHRIGVFWVTLHVSVLFVGVVSVRSLLLIQFDSFWSEVCAGFIWAGLEQRFGVKCVSCNSSKQLSMK